MATDASTPPALTSLSLHLSGCESEPIHIPGAIQPHGVLFAIDDLDFRIAQVSDNSLRLFGRGPSELLGRSIDDAIGSENLDRLVAAADRNPIEDANPLEMTVETLRGPRSVNAILHRSGGQIVVEIEPTEATAQTTFNPFYQNLRSSISHFHTARSVIDLCDAGAEEVIRLSGFDRVMVYRFDADWHGEVIAERCGDGVESFLGLHYPASDIPAQARDLFRQSWVRYIADVNYRPAEIVPAGNPITGKPLDLSRSVLRAVSPVHIEYLKNMRVGASMTVSLMKSGELWGLIACHHRTAKRVAYDVRTACEVIGRLMSLHLRSKEENEDIEYRLKIKTLQVGVLQALSRDADIAATLARPGTNLPALVGAAGAAIRFDETCMLVGQTPNRADCVAILDRFAAGGSDELFVTDALALVEPDFTPLASTASGILALPLSRGKRNAIVWFRPEALVTVNWGGDPHKASTTQDDLPIAPRKSFARWTEIVRLHAVPWQNCEIDVARDLRQVIATIIVERAEEIERVNRELTRSNVELQAFANVAAHDLKKPLRDIHTYATDLIEDYGALIDERGRDKLTTLGRLAQRMDAIVESLLELSSVGPHTVISTPTDLTGLVAEVIDNYASRLSQVHGRITCASPLPSVFGDAAGLRELFGGLFSNALKYRDQPPLIEVGVDSTRTAELAAPGDASLASSQPEFVTIFVRDNGIGIREKHLERIFEMFKRLHAQDAYGGGTGAGLAIARKIVERHGGSIRAESSFGHGTTIYLTLRRSS